MKNDSRLALVSFIFSGPFCFACIDPDPSGPQVSSPSLRGDAGETETEVKCDAPEAENSQACSINVPEEEDIPTDCEQDWFFDRDADGFGGELAGRSCTPMNDAVPRGGDCDDENDIIHPDSTERIDGVDANCNGVKDWLVKIYVAVDDAGELCINAEQIGDTGTWSDGKYYEQWMTSGVATIGIYGWDEGYHITAGIAHLELSDGTVWSTDASWMYSPDPNDESSKAGWCTPAFDDSGWQNVQDLGPIGVSPWGESPSIFPEDSPAHWVWDHFPVQLNSQYLRKVIVLP